MSVKNVKLLEKNEWLSCRDVLWYLIFCGCAVNYMLRINLSLAIVAMVEPRVKAVANVALCSQDVQLNSVHSSLWNNSSTLTNITARHSISKTLENNTILNHSRHPDRFSWDEYEQGLVLGGYYWLYWITQAPGGFFARRYGTKFIFGWANFGTALIGFLLPVAARYHLYAFVFLRALQGFTAGWIWCSMHHMVAKWIPPNEIGKFISSYFGNSIGAALTYPLSAFLINSFGWASVFYVTSMLGIIWCIAWYYLAYDSPKEHPRISNLEKSYILKSLGDSVNQESSKAVPWKSIFTSGPVWLVTITSFGAAWGIHTLNSEAPSYFNYIHGWKISAAGLISALPHVARTLFSYIFSSCVDWVLRKKIISKTNLRKFATLVTNGVQALLLFGLAYSGCHPTLAIVFMISAVAVHGAASSGILAASIDLSPNYASLIMGISNTVTATAGFISPLIVGYLTENNQTVEQWRLVFMIAAVIMSLTGVLFVLFGTTELQSWNDVGNEKLNEEHQKLRSSAYEIVIQEAKTVVMENKKETSCVDSA